MDYKSTKQVLDSFGVALNQHAGIMVATLKDGCLTYGDIDKAILRLKSNVIWSGERQYLPLIELAKKRFEDEKSRLLVADGFLNQTSSTDTTDEDL